MVQLQTKESMFHWDRSGLVMSKSVRDHHPRRAASAHCGTQTRRGTKAGQRSRARCHTVVQRKSRFRHSPSHMQFHESLQQCPVALHEKRSTRPRKRLRPSSRRARGKNPLEPVLGEKPDAMRTRIIQMIQQVAVGSTEDQMCEGFVAPRGSR